MHTNSARPVSDRSEPKRQTPHPDSRHRASRTTVRNAVHTPLAKIPGVPFQSGKAGQIRKNLRKNNTKPRAASPTLRIHNRYAG